MKRMGAVPAQEEAVTAQEERAEVKMALELTALADLRRMQIKSGLPVGMMLSFRYEPMFHTARKLVQASSGAL